MFYVYIIVSLNFQKTYVGFTSDIEKRLIAHNHPSGTALPSGSDLDTTIVLKSTLATVGVELIDHFIITDDDYVSLRESRLAGNIFYYEK